MGFGGATAWTVDLDDFGNRCCREVFPLLRAVARILGRLDDEEPAPGCARPPAPVTPPPPTLTTAVDSGKFRTGRCEDMPEGFEATVDHELKNEQNRIFFL